MRKITIFSLIISLMIAVVPFNITKASDTWSLAFISSEGKASLSKDGSYSSSFALTDKTLTQGYTIYYKGNNNQCISSLKLYEKNSDNSLTFISEYDLDSATSYYDHLWFKPKEAKKYVLKAEFKRQNDIKIISQNIVSSIDHIDQTKVSNKGFNNVTYSTDVLDGSSHTIYFYNIPEGFAIGTSDEEHINDLYLTITQYGQTFVDYAIKDEKTNMYTYTLNDCHAQAMIEAKVRLKPTDNVTKVYVDDVLKLTDDNLNSNYFHVHRMDDDAKMTIQVEKWIPKLNDDYRFNHLYHYELDLSKAFNVIGYRFYTRKKNETNKTLKVSATISNNKQTSTNGMIDYQYYEQISDRYVISNASYNSKNPLYFYNWNENIYEGQIWECLSQTSFSQNEINQCINSLHIFDFINKTCDDLYNTYLIMEVDIQKKANIDLRESQYQYLNNKTHVFNGGYYFRYNNGVDESINKSKAKVQQGALAVLKLQFDPHKVSDSLWIQRSHRWDFARDIFTIFQYDLITKVRNGTLMIKDKDNTTISSNNTFKEQSSKVDAALDVVITYEANEGYTLKNIILDDQQLERSNYPNEYIIESMNQDHEFSVEFVKAYKIITSVENGKISTSDHNVAQGDRKEIIYKANEGYRLKEIIVDGIKLNDEQLKASSNEYIFTNVNANHEIKVIYEKVHKIETSVENGVISKSVEGIKTNSDQLITFKPNDGYYLYSLLIDDQEYVYHYDQSLKQENTYLFKDINSDHTIKAIFKKQAVITIIKKIDPKQTHLPSGIPTFFFHIEGIDFLNKHHSLYRMIEFDDEESIKQVVIDDLPYGKYQIYEIDCARYLSKVTSFTQGISKISDYQVLVSPNEENSSVTFMNTRDDYHNLDHNDLVINEFNVRK